MTYDNFKVEWFSPNKTWILKIGLFHYETIFRTTPSLRQLIKGRVVTIGIDVILGFDVTVAVVVDEVIPGSLIVKAVLPYRGYYLQ